VSELRSGDLLLPDSNVQDELIDLVIRRDLCLISHTIFSSHIGEALSVYPQAMYMEDIFGSFSVPAKCSTPLQLASACSAYLYKPFCSLTGMHVTKQTDYPSASQTVTNRQRASETCMESSASTKRGRHPYYWNVCKPTIAHARRRL
jgi:hypothetical protein